MWNMLWPVLVVVGANTLYNICAKSVPEEINSYASLVITYGVAAVCSLVMYVITAEQKSLAAELSRANWTSWALGIAVVGLEFGFICLYRAGWKVSVGHLTTSALLSCVLLAVGVLGYRETVSLRQILGIVICGTGLVLMTGE